MKCTSISCMVFMWAQEKNQPRIGANSASRWLAPRIGFADPHSRSLGLVANQRLSQALVVDFVANPFDPTAPPSSGPFGQILSPPRRLLLLICLLILCRDCQ